MRNTQQMLKFSSLTCTKETHNPWGKSWKQIIMRNTLTNLRWDHIWEGCRGFVLPRRTWALTALHTPSSRVAYSPQEVITAYVEYLAQDDSVQGPEHKWKRRLNHALKDLRVCCRNQWEMLWQVRSLGHVKRVLLLFLEWGSSEEASWRKCI